jgi:hypothetical protein
VKSLVDLLGYLLLDCERRSGAALQRDVKTLRLRVKHEGDSFITITLPNFCRDFERSLAEGRVVPGLFLSFGKTKSGVPEFLQGLLHQVFDDEATLLDHPSIEAIRLVRQICLFGKKILRPCSHERDEDALMKYVQCDDDVALKLDGALFRTFKRVAKIILQRTDLEDPELLSRIVPKHGPGATRERIMNNQKWVFRRWHQRLEDAGMAFLRFGRASPLVHAEEEFQMPDLVEPEDEEPVRVVLVPKTLRTPRVIAVEPVCMQYMQQGLSRILVKQLESCTFTRGHVNFRDQSVNRQAASKASKDGRHATLDMSDASDRVGVAHVKGMFESTPKFLELVLASRSQWAELPGGDKVALAKFASMGSALCFPVEAVVFFTSIIASRLNRAGLFPTERSVHSFGRDVLVYGDDLIVPAREAPEICEDLESLGFKVNRSKSFWTGKFRESCGMEVYDNEQVTPVYLRRDLPSDFKDASGILSGVSTSNQLYSAGYHLTAMAMRKAIEKITGKLPLVPPESPAVGWFENSDSIPPLRYCPNLQRLFFRCLVPVVPKMPDPLDGDPALAKCFRLIGVESIDPEHLETSPRPYGLTLKRRWVPLDY